jgi:hypothetical protein
MELTKLLTTSDYTTPILILTFHHSDGDFTDYIKFPLQMTSENKKSIITFLNTVNPTFLQLVYEHYNSEQYENTNFSINVELLDKFADLVKIWYCKNSHIKMIRQSCAEFRNRSECARLAPAVGVAYVSQPSVKPKPKHTISEDNDFEFSLF